jgi:hypothetical protein
VEYVGNNHFLDADFTMPERKRLNRGTVPRSSDSASQEPTPRLSDVVCGVIYINVTYFQQNKLLLICHIRRAKYFVPKAVTEFKNNIRLTRRM